MRRDRADEYVDPVRGVCTPSPGASVRRQAASVVAADEIEVPGALGPDE
ncbi:MAG TPA: hypothetical protein VFG98_03315 [Intrasporangium sp.]|nr:hypothetical protein [Intrasporangium sp.]